MIQVNLTLTPKCVSYLNYYIATRKIENPRIRKAETIERAIMEFLKRELPMEYDPKTGEVVEV